MRLDHIGIVVKDLKEAEKYYKNLYGFDARSSIIDEPAKDVKIMFIDVGLSDIPTIELIQPITENSAVYNFLKTKGGGLHHLSYEVEDFDKAVDHFKQQKSIMVGEIYPGAGHKGQRVAWFYTAFKELIELIERRK